MKPDAKDRLTEDHGVLAARLAEARARTDEVFALVDPAALYERPIPERHRLIFYLGHLEAFDRNLVARHGFGIASFNEPYDQLFAFGIDPADGGQPREPASDWPRRESIEDYNDRARQVVDECVAGRHERRSPHDEATLFEMAIEHRLMHAETLAYLLHQLPHEAKRRPRPRAAPPVVAPANAEDRLVGIPAGTTVLGRRTSEGGYGWDNEFGTCTSDVPEFSMDGHKVTNARYLEFVREGGYETASLWTEPDWSWKEREGIRHPRFWQPRGEGFLYRGMFATTPLPLNAPVYVSHAEATAFARWAGGALPTEAQFHRAAYGTPEGGEREYPWGDAAPGARHGNFDFHGWDPTPVGSYPAGDSAFSVSELVGNGWEWTSTLFAPLPGFRAHPLYPGYSAPFFDGAHFVLKGGSPRTAAVLLRRSFRNWFRPHYEYVHAGFRVVRP